MLHKATFVIVLGFIPVVIAQSTLPSPNGFCSGDMCYIRPDTDATKAWAAALQICKNYNATLPIADNPNSRNIFETALRNYNLIDKDVWLGATAVEYNSSIWRWVDGTQFSATDFATVTSYYYNSYAILTKDASGLRFVQSPANISWPYICQYPIDSDACRNGTQLKLFSLDDSCYVKHEEEKLSWFSARNKCIERNGDLAFFKDLSILSTNINSNGAWVGLRHSQWNWKNAVDGSSFEVKYTFWSSDQPDDLAPTCIRTKPNDYPRWQDWNCSRSCNYICQVNRVTQVIPSIATSSSTKATSSTISQPESAATNVKQEVNLPLAVGLGVGLGAGAILVIVVVIIVLVARRKHKNRGSNGNATSRKRLADQIGQDNPAGETTEMDRNQLKLNDPSTSYETAQKVRGFEINDHSNTSSSQSRLGDPSANYATVQEALGTEHNSQLVPSSINHGPVYADLGFSVGRS